MNRTLPVLVVCASLTACGPHGSPLPGEEVALSEFTRSIFLGLHDGPAEDGVDALGAVVTLGQPRLPACLSIRRDVRVELNGTELEIEIEGYGGQKFGERQCYDPQLRAVIPRSALPQGADGLLVIEEPGGARFEVEVPQLFGSHQVARTEPASAVVTGTDVAFTWTRPETWNSVDYGVTASFDFPGRPLGNNFFTVEASPSAEGAVVHVPRSLPAGPAMLRVNLLATPEARRCEGPSRCDISYLVGRSFSVQVQ